MEDINNTKELINKIKKYGKMCINIFFIFILSYILSFIVNTYLIFIEKYTVQEFWDFLNSSTENINIFLVFKVLYKSFKYEVFQILRILFITTFLGIYYLKYHKKSLIDFFHKYRYLICFIVFFICIIFEFNGSSIGIYSNVLKNEETNGVIWGKSRNIRADEFSVNTPMALSQVKTGFKWINDSFRGTDSQMFIVYGQPVLDISMIFRLFQIGYLIFGEGRGLAFFWCLRLIVLFITSYEFGLLLFNKNKKLSLTFGILMVFSPVVQWWFAINGLVEMIISAELGIIVFKNYLVEEKVIMKLVNLIVLWICIGTFLFTFYPAWMIPCFYIFLPIVIWIVIENRKKIKFSRIDLILSFFLSIVFLLLIGRVFFKSYDVINLTLNTVYPGNRLSTGGEENNLKLYLNQFTNIFLPTNREIGNECETALFIDFSYITVFLICYLYFKEKYFKDILINLIMIFEVFLNFYIIFGFPSFLSNITFMSYTLSIRVIQVIGILNLILIFRILSVDEIKEKIKFKNKINIIISLIISCLIVILLLVSYRSFFTYSRLIITAIISFIICLIILKRNYNLLIIISIVLMFLSSMFVNPLRIGSDVISKVEVFENLVKIDKEDTGIWMIEEKNYSLPKNLFPMYGIKTINSVNVYPNLEKWKCIDKENIYEDIYNRYAHIKMFINSEIEKSKFTLIRADSFEVVINENNIKELGIKYIVRNVNEEDLKLDKIVFNEVYKDTILKVYRLSY